MNRRKPPASSWPPSTPSCATSSSFGLVMDSPRIVVVRHDIHDDDDGGSIRRVVVDADGVVEDVVVPLEHACLSCAVREDALPTLAPPRRATRRWDSVVLALPGLGRVAAGHPRARVGDPALGRAAQAAARLA